MDIVVEKIEKEDWKEISRDAHLIVFEKIMPPDLERIDFALLAKRGDELLGYLTCREFDAETLYCAHGGTFPGTRATSLSVSVYLTFIKWAEKNYKRVATLIENNNRPMLKLALHAGYKIVGLRSFKGSVLLEHLLEFEKCD